MSCPRASLGFPDKKDPVLILDTAERCGRLVVEGVDAAAAAAADIY